MNEHVDATASEVLTLRCKQCGAQAQPGCNCGVGYDYVSPSKLAERAIKANPEKSDRAIAADLGVGRETIRRARHASAPNGAVEKRVGRDGKARRHPKRPDVVTKHEKIVALSDGGLSASNIAAEVGVTPRMVDRVLEVENERRKARADPTIDRSELSMTAQAKLDAAIRQHKKKLDQDFEARIQIEYRARFEKNFPDMQKRYNDAYRSEQLYTQFLQQQKKIFTVDQFKVILMCLHPDGERSAGKLTEAFRLFNGKRFALTGEKS